MAGLNILYVEDDARLAEDLAQLMAREGHRLAWTPRGEDGLARAGAEPFDVVILDRMLPDLSGIEIVRRMRDAGIAAPVLMLSALGRADNRTEGLDAGVDDYMAKPFDAPELIA